MWKGMVDDVTASFEEPKDPDTADEDWDNGTKTFITMVEGKEKEV